MTTNHPLLHIAALAVIALIVGIIEKGGLV